MADFPDGGGGGGRQPMNLGRNLLFGKIFAENSMKMKEIGSANFKYNWFFATEFSEAI